MQWGRTGCGQAAKIETVKAKETFREARRCTNSVAMPPPWRSLNRRMNSIQVRSCFSTSAVAMSSLGRREGAPCVPRVPAAKPQCDGRRRCQHHNRQSRAAAPRERRAAAPRLRRADRCADRGRRKTPRHLAGFGGTHRRAHRLRVKAQGFETQEQSFAWSWTARWSGR